jgi:hypothetical protein
MSKNRPGGGRLEEHPEFARFVAAAPFLIEKLIELNSWLAATYPEGHTFRRISAQQSDAAAERLVANKDNITDAVAVIYSHSLYVRQLETSVFATANVLTDFIDAAVHAAKGKRLGLFLCHLRCMLERFAHVRYLVTEIQPRLKELPNATATSPFLNAMDALEGLSRKALYGTRVDWNSIAQKELKDVDLRKDVIWPPRKEVLGDYFAEQIKKKMDALETAAPGASACYYILCEFAHPNDGDLLASTAQYGRRRDRFGVVHITRTLGRGLISQDTNANLGVTLSRVFVFMADLIERAKADFETLQQCLNQLREQLSTHMQRVVRKQKHLFTKNDLCVCLSGRAIAKCCGRRLVWVR